MRPALHRAMLCLGLGLTLAACVPTKSPFNTNTSRTRKYASARMLNLLSDFTAADAIISVTDDLPGGFSSVPAPGITAWQPVATGDWSAYLSIAEASRATVSSRKVEEGDRLTLVASGPSTGATLAWTQEQAPTLTADQAGARVVVGASRLAGAEIKVGATTVTSSAVVSAVSDWTAFTASQGLTVTVSLPGEGDTFNVPVATAGALHTLAVVEASASDPSLRLIEFVETAGGDATAGAPLLPTP